MSLTAMDYEETRQMLAWNIDRGNAEAYAADYAPDGSFEVLGVPAGAEHAGKHQDRVGVVRFIGILYAGTKGQVRHWNQNFVFRKVTDNEVEVSSYLICVRVGMVPQSDVTRRRRHHQAERDIGKADDESDVWLPARMAPLIRQALEGYQHGQHGPGQHTFAELLATPAPRSSASRCATPTTRPKRASPSGRRPATPRATTGATTSTSSAPRLPAG